RRQRADGVDGDAAQELLVGAQFARHDVEALQLGEDLAVDEVDFVYLRIDEAGGGLQRHHDADGEDVASIADDHGGVAGLPRLDLAEVIDRDDGLVVGAIVTKSGDVLGGAVREGGLHAQLAGEAGPGEGKLGRLDGDAGDSAA